MIDRVSEECEKREEGLLVTGQSLLHMTDCIHSHTHTHTHTYTAYQTMNLAIDKYSLDVESG